MSGLLGALLYNHPVFTMAVNYLLLLPHFVKAAPKDTNTAEATLKCQDPVSDAPVL